MNLNVCMYLLLKEPYIHGKNLYANYKQNYINSHIFELQKQKHLSFIINKNLSNSAEDVQIRSFLYKAKKN